MKYRDSFVKTCTIRKYWVVHELKIHLFEIYWVVHELKKHVFEIYWVVHEFIILDFLEFSKWFFLHWLHSPTHQNFKALPGVLETLRCGNWTEQKIIRNPKFRFPSKGINGARIRLSNNICQTITVSQISGFNLHQLRLFKKNCP